MYVSEDSMWRILCEFFYKLNEASILDEETVEPHKKWSQNMSSISLCHAWLVAATVDLPKVKAPFSSWNFLNSGTVALSLLLDN